MKNDWKTILFALIIGIIIGICVNFKSCTQQNPIIERIPIHDTITLTQDRIVQNTIVKYVTDTVYQVDSVFQVGDISYVVLPQEFKEYNDTIKTDSTSTVIDIKYHGISASIDNISLQHNYNKIIEKQYIQPKRFAPAICVGPYVGYGINGPQAGIGIMIGIDYRLKK